MPAIEILLVEDSPADAELTRQGFLRSPYDHNLHLVEHGGKAISFLHREGEFSEAPRPDLILLDLDMPHLDGFGVLKHVKSVPDLCDIPIVVLSSLGEPEKISETHQLQADAYLAKPANFEQFVVLVRNLCDYWLRKVQLTD